MYERKETREREDGGRGRVVGELRGKRVEGRGEAGRRIMKREEGKRGEGSG